MKLALLLLAAVVGRAGEVGLPFVTHFSPTDYAANQQVWSVTQDDRGILFFGHGGGVLEYDGTTWRKIATPHGGPVRTIARGRDGRIYVGEVGDFGYLEPDQAGEMKYVSLVQLVAKEDRDFQDVYRVHSTPEGLYFQAREKMFRLTPDGKSWRVKSWTPKKVFRYSFYTFGSLYVGSGGEGFQRVVGDRLETVPLPIADLEQSVDGAVVLFLPYSTPGEAERQMLLGTRGGHLFLVGNGRATRFAPQTESLLRELKLGYATMLPDGAFAITTRGGGILILERDGTMRRHLSRLEGIPSDGTLEPFVDRSGTLWVGLQNGIAKVEVSSPFSEFAQSAGLAAAVNDIRRFEGSLYAGTMNGLRVLDSGAGAFRRLGGSEFVSVFGLAAHGDSLLAANGRDGMFEIKGGKIKPALRQTDVSHFCILVSRQDPNRVWLGTNGGLAAMRREKSGLWVDEGLVAPGPTVRTMVEAEPGLLWLGTESRGVMRVRLNGGSLANAQVDRFTMADGLPWDGAVDVMQAGGRVVFMTIKGVREFNAATKRFVESKAFGTIPAGGEAGASSQVTDPDGNVWMNVGLRPVLFVKQGDGSFKMDETPLRRVGDGVVTWLFGDRDGVLWLGGNDRMFRYDRTKAAKGAEKFAALVRRVTAGEREKVLLFGGSGEAGSRSIAYRDNALRFEYAATSFMDPKKNHFQTRLEGFDRDWSEWTTETRRDYTNLPPGKYRFVVRAKNLLDQLGAEAEYGLEILPPWYRTWWAYALYALLAVALVVGSDRAMRRRLIARERARSEAKMLHAEVERKRNVELLSEMGKELTSSLEMDTIFVKLYEHVNQLMDATIFGVGVYHPGEHTIEYRLAFDKGKRYEPYRRDTRNKDQFPVWCIENRKPVFVNDVATEYSRYIRKYEELQNRLEDGSISETPQSLIYLPLVAKDRVLGILTVQSFQKNAYTEYQLNLLQNLAAYTSIALDNADAYQHLKSAQEQLVVQEKLASLGALTAGIAHEIKNPLNFVNNFADLSVELMGELREEIAKLKSGGEPDMDNVEGLLDDLSGNARKINEHGKRADGIVKSMLLHSRGQAGEREATDINSMLEEYVGLSYHGMRAQDSTFNLAIEKQFGADVGKVDAIPQDLSRVFLNILNNACYAAHDKAKKLGGGFKPELRVRTVNLGDAVEVRIRDNGMGIPPEVRDRIFNPFFTTKPTGQGTGLGLSISHDIVVLQHGGQLEVETEAGEFTEFVVRLPRQWRKAA